MLNHVVLIGRLTAAPELRYTQNKKAVVSFRLAVKRDIGEDTDYINCTAWGKTAEFVDQFFHKGSLIVLIGRIQSNRWTDKDGKKHYDTEVVADRVWFGEPKKKEQDGAQDDGAFKDPYIEYGEPDGDLPF